MSMKEIKVKMPNLYDAIQDDMEMNCRLIFSDAARVRLVFPDDDTWNVAIQEVGKEEMYIFEDPAYSNTSDDIVAELRSIKGE